MLHYPIVLAAILSTGDALKIALYEAMRADGVTPSDLARRLQTTSRGVDRLLDLVRPAGLDDLETALRALDRDLTVVVGRAA